MSGVLFGMFYIMPDWLLGTMLWRLLRLMAVVVAGIAAYFAALAVLGFKVKSLCVGCVKNQPDGGHIQPAGRR